MVGIDLGCSIYMIDKNLDIIKKLEEARRDMYFQNIKTKNDGEKKRIDKREEEIVDIPVH